MHILFANIHTERMGAETTFNSVRSISNHVEIKSVRRRLEQLEKYVFSEDVLGKEKYKEYVEAETERIRIRKEDGELLAKLLLIFVAAVIIAASIWIWITYPELPVFMPNFLNWRREHRTWSDWYHWRNL